MSAIALYTSGGARKQAPFCTEEGAVEFAKTKLDSSVWVGSYCIYTRQEPEKSDGPIVLASWVDERCRPQEFTTDDLYLDWQEALAEAKFLRMEGKPARATAWERHAQILSDYIDQSLQSWF